MYGEEKLNRQRSRTKERRGDNLERMDKRLMELRTEGEIIQEMREEYSEIANFTKGCHTLAVRFTIS